MISIERALDIIQNQNIQKKIVETKLAETLGFYLAEEIKSPFCLPSFDNSAMDGYAVSGEYETYSIVGEIAAGDGYDYTLQSGQAMRIFTGARVPGNTTAVVMQERTITENGILYIDEKIISGQNIRKKGSELIEGQSVFLPGHLISPATVGLIGSLGMDKVKTFKKPVVRIVTTGNELVQPGMPREEGQIYESNSYALHSALQRYGFDSCERVHIQDDLSAIKTGLTNVIECSDIVLISGGISVGEYDFVRKALIDIGVDELFYKVYQKPGKPLYFGRKEDRFIFALPGNPASSLTCFYIHVLPLLQKFSGATKTGLLSTELPVTNDFDYKADRPVFLKARIEGQAVSILDRQGSSMIHSLAMGNALVYLKGPKNIRYGDKVHTIII